jgi:hypothetical protein
MYENLINAVMNSELESGILNKASSDEEITIDKISWAKAADAYSMLLKFATSWSCYSVQEVMQLRVYILHSTFSAKTKKMHQASRH